MNEQRLCGKAAFSLRLVVFAMAAASTSNACAQEELLKDLFPGVAFSRYLDDAEADLFASSYARIESDGREFVALTYYQPYPNAPRLRVVSYALLEVTGEDFTLRLDQLATDDGSGREFRRPFLYSVDSEDLVVFPSCYRGCGYSFFRVDTSPTEVTLESYDGLSAEESFPGPGDFRFDDSELSATFRVARPGDATCCASGGTLDVFYELRGNQFEISRVERNESAPESQ